MVIIPQTNVKPFTVILTKLNKSFDSLQEIILVETSLHYVSVGSRINSTLPILSGTK